MVVFPQTAEQWQALTRFLNQHAGVSPSADLRVIGWVVDGQIKVVVGLNGFIGKVCQIHIAMDPGFHFSPKELLQKVFDYAFNDAKVEILLGVVNSKNTSAMRYDAKLGFSEMFRLKGVHDDGGDLVLLSMHRAECRYLEKEHAA